MINNRIRMHDVQRNLETTGISGVRESVTLFNCLQEPDCEAVSLLFVGNKRLFRVLCFLHLQ